MNALQRFARNTFSSLTIRNFRLYFIGHVFSQSGSWMQTVALGWLVLDLTHSGTQLGIIVALQFVPLLCFGPWGGLIADTYNKRNILYSTQIGFAAPIFTVSALMYIDALHIWMLYVVAFLLGIVRVFDVPARQTFVSELVDSDNVRNAVSLNATAGNTARVVGPAIGGFLIAGMGIGTSFFVNGLMYLITIFMLSRLRKEELLLMPKQEKSKGQLREGFKYAMETPLIRNTLFLMAFIGTFAYEWQVSLPLMAERVYFGDASMYASLLSALGVGSIIGGLYSAGRRKIVPHHLADIAILFGLCIVGTALMPTIYYAIAGMFIVGFLSINLTSLGNTMLQLESRPEMRGRVLSLWSMAMMGSTAIGGPIIGIVGECFGGRWALGIGGLVTFLIATYMSRELLKDRFYRFIPAWFQRESITE